MITIEVNGQVYQGFTQIQVENIFFAISGGVVITATLPQNTTFNFPIKNQDNIRVYVNNITIMNGYIDEITISYDSGSAGISIKARDITSDLIDSSLGGGLTFNAPITLQQITQNILGYLGITNVSVSTSVPIAPFVSSEIINPEIGENAFAFLEKYARKRQVIPTTDGNGNIIYMQSSQVPVTTQLYNLIGKGSNILGGTATYTSMARYNKYVCYSQGVGSTEGSTDSPDQGDISSFSGSASDNQVRPSRVYHFVAESASTAQECQKRAIWEANWQRAQSFKYVCTVAGFGPALDPTAIWRPNTLVTVQDQFCNIAAQLLISKVIFSYAASGAGGNYTTTLEMVTRDAFTLEAQTPSRTVEAETTEEGPEYNNLNFNYYGSPTFGPTQPLVGPPEPG